MIVASSAYIAAKAVSPRTPIYRARFWRDWYANEVIADSPSLYLPFDDIATTAAADASGNGLNGTYQGSPVLGLPGISGRESSTRHAVRLNGASQYITVADNPLLDPGDTFTLSIWVKPYSLGTNVLFSKGTAGYLLRLESGVVKLYKQGTAGAIVSSSTAVAVNVWSHIVVTKSGSTSSVIINGGNVTSLGTNQTIASTATDLSIGRDSAGADYFDGLLDEATIFPTALSGARILLHYRAGSMCLLFSTGLVAGYDDEVMADRPNGYWRLSESSGSAADSSGNGLTGSYNGSPGLASGGVPLTGSSLNSVALDGSSQWISVADNNKLDLGDTFTLEAMVKLSSLTTYPRILSKGANGYALYLSNGKVGLFKEDSAGGGAESTVALTVGSWGHVAATKDGSALHIYVDGVDVTGFVGATTFADTSTALAIGRYHGGGEYVPGSLANVAVYAHALSAVRVRAHYDASLALFPNDRWKSYLQVPRGTSAQVQPHQGSSSIESMALQIVDADMDLTRMVALGIKGASVTLDNGFLGLQGEEFATRFIGTVQAIRKIDGGYDITVQSPQALANKQAFPVSRSRLDEPMVSGDTIAYIRDASGFQASGYARIDDELIAYASKNLGQSIPGYDWLKVAYGSGLWVAVGAGAAASSPDGVSWTIRGVPQENTWTGVCYASGGGFPDGFYAVSSDGINRMMYSADGLSWSLLAMSFAESISWQAIAAYGSIIVAIATDGIDRAMYSVNGLDWYMVANTVGGYAVGWNGTYFHTGNDISFDGKLWTRNTGLALAMTSIVWSGTHAIWVIGGHDGTNGQIFTSDDSLHWCERKIRSGSVGPVTSIAVAPAYSGGIDRFVAVTSDGDCAYSDGGLNWYRAGVMAGGGFFQSVCWADSLGLFVAVGSGGGNYVATSADGISWTSQTAANNYAWKQVIWAKNVGGTDTLVAVAMSAVSQPIMTSTDGASWTARSTPNSRDVSAVCWSETLQKFVATTPAFGDNILHSGDGVTWLQTTNGTGSSTQWTSITWSELYGEFVAVGLDSAADNSMTSTNGTAWSAVAAPQNYLQCIVWGDSATTFLAVGVPSLGAQPGRPAYSIDGAATWSYNGFTFDETGAICYGITWAGALSVWVMVGSNYYSADGLNWTAYTPAEANTWRDICWSSTLGLLVAVSLNGTNRVMTSPDATTWTARTINAVQWAAVAENGAGTVVAVAITGPGRSAYSTNGTTWTNPPASSLAGLTRGIDLAGVLTEAAAHDFAAGVNEILYKEGHPCDLLAEVHTGTDKFGLSIDAGLIDTATLDIIKTAIGSTFKTAFLIDAPENGKAWVEALCKAIGIYPVLIGAVQSFRKFETPSGGDSVAALDSTNIVADPSGNPQLTWDGDCGVFVNVVTFQFDRNLSGQYESTAEFSDAASIATYGRIELVIPCDGFRSSLGGAGEVMEAIATDILNRYANGAPAVTVRTLLTNDLIEAGDVVKVTSDRLPNPTTAALGVTEALMEVVKRSSVFDSGYVDLTLQWSSWGQ